MNPDKILKVVDGAVDFIFGRKPPAIGIDTTAFEVWDRSGQALIICPFETLERLNKLELEHRRTVNVLNTHTDEAARIDYTKHQKTLEDAIRGGAESKAEAWGIQEWKDEYEAKREAAREILKKIYTEAQAIAAPIAAEYVKIAKDKADGMEESERENHEIFGVKWTGPSAVVKEIRRTIGYVNARSKWNEHGASAPSGILPFIKFDL